MNDSNLTAEELLDFRDIASDPMLRASGDELTRLLDHISSQRDCIAELEQQLRESNERGIAATARVIELERASTETLPRQHMNALHQDAIEVKGKALEADSYLSTDIAKLIDESCICKDHLCITCQSLLYAIGALEVRANRQYQLPKERYVSAEFAAKAIDDGAECDACDKPREYCARPYGICVRTQSNTEEMLRQSIDRVSAELKPIASTKSTENK